MAEKKPDKDVQLTGLVIEAVQEGGSDAVKTALSTGDMHQALSSGGLAFLGKLFWGVAFRLDKRRMVSWLKSVGVPLGLLGPEDDPTEAMARLGAKLENEATEQTIIESWAKARDALDPVVLPALGRLTAEYLKQDRKPDAFFRGLGRVLVELDEEEFSTLRALLTKGLDFLGEASWVALHASPTEVGGHKPSEAVDLEQVEAVFEGINPKRAKRVLYLIDTNELGELEGRWGERSSREAVLARETLLRLDALVNGPPDTSPNATGDG